MRRAAKVDANQAEIVRVLRQLGASVEVTSGLGKGYPDLTVGYRGANYLLELKDGRKPPSARRLTPDEVAWHESWRGQVAVVKDLDEALAAIGIQAA